MCIVQAEALVTIFGEAPLLAALLQLATWSQLDLVFG